MNISLSPLTQEDVSALAYLANNPQIAMWVRDIFPSPYSDQDAINFLDYLATQQPLATFGIRYEEKLVGVCGLVLQGDIFRKSAEIGYWLGEPFWGKGIAKEGVKLLCKWGFEELGLVRIYGGVFSANTSSMRVLEKAGFHLESVAKKALVKRGEIYDDYIFRMTVDEWENLNKNL
ncbi:MAG: GNAT family N-acetyltransferase [Thermoflexibacter sp.]|nr:GNAT family N-acetyltransferase [Thermoflexibacter sp.]